MAHLVDSTRTAADAAEIGVVQRKGTRARIAGMVAQNGTVFVVVLLLIIFGLTSKFFLTAGNIFNIWQQMTIVAVLGIGMTLVILIGGIDLSVGSVLYLSAGLCAVLLKDGVPSGEIVLIALLAATLVGILNGVLVEVAGISPVIITLGVLIGVRGLSSIIMSNAQLPVSDPLFDFIAVTRTPGIASIKLPGLPMMVIIMAVLYLIMAVLLRQTSFGRYIYAIGGNQTASHLAGVPVVRVKVLAYTLSGLFAGVGGILMAAQQGVIGPGIGSGLEFYAVAAVVLGGARLSGGVGRVEKTLLGAMILYMVFNYMTLAHVPAVWQQTVIGLLVLAEVILDRVTQRGQG